MPDQKKRILTAVASTLNGWLHYGLHCIPASDSMVVGCVLEHRIRDQRETEISGLLIIY